jgi:tRNA(fMet)-specific endonuclease VapC
VRVLDTDVCVEILRGNQRVIGRRLEVEDEVATTWITACELLYGAAKSRDPARDRMRVAEFCSSLRVLDFVVEVAVWFGDLKHLLERAGSVLHDPDLIIGATVLAYDSVLVTGNTRHYGRIRDLRMEDWIRG